MQLGFSALPPLEKFVPPHQPTVLPCAPYPRTLGATVVWKQGWGGSVPMPLLAEKTDDTGETDDIHLQGKTVGKKTGEGEEDRYRVGVLSNGSLYFREVSLKIFLFFFFEGLYF